MGTGVFAWFSWPPSARDGLGESESDRVREVRMCEPPFCLAVCPGSDLTALTLRIYGSRLDRNRCKLPPVITSETSLTPGRHHAYVVLTFTPIPTPRSTPRTRWRRCNATPNEQILALQCPCSPKGPPPSPLHGKPRSAHRRCGGCAPNRRIHRGVCPQSPSWLIAVQSSASKSRGELQRRLFEHRPKAHSCIFPASSTIRARRP